MLINIEYLKFSMGNLLIINILPTRFALLKKVTLKLHNTSASIVVLWKTFQFVAADIII